jgi:hypothetical protein
MPTSAVRGAILKAICVSNCPPVTVNCVKMLSEAGNDALDGCTLWPEARATKRRTPDKRDAIFFLLATVDVATIK